MIPAVMVQGLFFVFPSAMVYSAIADLVTMTLSNKIVVFLVAGFLLLAPLTGMDWTALALHGAAGGMVLAAGFLLFALGWIGGGDAKLAAAIALWVGPDHILAFIAMASVLGGVMTLAILTFRRAVLPESVLRHAWVQRLHHDDAGIPYGVALAAGALAVYPATIWATLAAA